MVLLFFVLKKKIKNLRVSAFLFAAVLAASLLLVCSGCATEKQNVLVIASEQTGNLNPVTAKGYDKKILSLIFSDLITVDREGKILKNAASGEISVSSGKEYLYEGICSIREDTDFIFARPVKIFTFDVREDVHFSDGIALTADDCIFTLYMLLDEGYDGSSSVNMLDIVGYDKYSGRDYNGEELAEFNEKYGIEQSNRGISGIIKNNAYSFSVAVWEGTASHLYRFCGVKILPLHYYGRMELYNPSAGSFGFVKGDITPVKNVTVPLGSGSYKFYKNTLNCVYLKNNEGFFAGCPKIPYICFQVQNPENAAMLVEKGVCDMAFPSVKRMTFEELKNYESVKTVLWNSSSFGYIGLNACNVCVGEADSKESAALREALIMLINSEREIAVNTYYGNSAEIADIPLSLNAGNSAYFKTNRDLPDRTVLTGANLLNAVRNKLMEAGFVFEDGKAVKAPGNAKLQYQAMLAGEGKGEHPSFDVLTGVKNKLNEIGMDLKITDCADPYSMWSKLKAGEGEIWCAAAGGGYVSELYALYHSGNKYGNNYFSLKDREMDSALELMSRMNGEECARCTEKCLDIISRWKVIAPVYRRKECVIYNSKNLTGITDNPTCYYGILNEMHKLEMTGGKR